MRSPSPPRICDQWRGHDIVTDMCVWVLVLSTACFPLKQLISQPNEVIGFTESGKEFHLPGRQLVRTDLPPVATLDSRNRLYILDEQRMVIDVLNAKGEIVVAIPDTANDIKGFAPRTFAVSQDSIVAALGRYGRTIYFFTTKGRHV